MKAGTRAGAIRAVLFDKDGTLLDFSATWAGVYRFAATQLAAEQGKPDLADRLLRDGGMDPDTSQFDPGAPLACATTPEIAALWGRTAGLADVPALAARLERLFATLEARRLAPVAGLADALGRLHAAGLQLGVATMDSAAMAQSDLLTLGMRERFAFVCGYDSGFGHKPGPGMVNAFCAATKLPPDAVAMVGDTPHDLRMGRAAAAGLVVGVLTGAAARTELDPFADIVLGSIAELPDTLGR